MANDDLKLSFGIMRKDQTKLDTFTQYKNLFTPTLYHVDMRGVGKRYTTIPLQSCFYDSLYEDVTLDGSLICPKSFDTSRGSNDISVGELGGVPGQPGSSYMVFGISFLDKTADISQDFLDKIRIVAYASSSYVDLEGDRSEPTKKVMRQISSSHLSLFSERVFEVPVSQNEITFESEFPIYEPATEHTYTSVGQALSGERFFEGTFKKDEELT